MLLLVDRQRRQRLSAGNCVRQGSSVYRDALDQNEWSS